MSKAPIREHRGPCVTGLPAPQPAIQDALDALDWSRTELAQRTGLGLNAVRRYINGDSRPRVGVADAIADELGLTWSEAWAYERPEQEPALQVRPIEGCTPSACVEVQMQHLKAALSAEIAESLAEEILQAARRGC